MFPRTVLDIHRFIRMPSSEITLLQLMISNSGPKKIFSSPSFQEESSPLEESHLPLEVSTREVITWGGYHLRESFPLGWYQKGQTPQKKWQLTNIWVLNARKEWYFLTSGVGPRLPHPKRSRGWETDWAGWPAPRVGVSDFVPKKIAHRTEAC